MADEAAGSRKRCVAEAAKEGGCKRARTWNVKLGERAAGISNPIREIMDKIAGKENPRKRMISLAQGDPTAYPHLRPGDSMVRALVAAVNSGVANGYQPSQGSGAARAAVAKEFSVRGRPPLTPNDVFMTLGCSEALSHCVAALAFQGSNLLLPRPGFCLYEVLCKYHGVEPRYYDLLPNNGWQLDLKQLRGLVDENTCGFLVNNPSNPCGAVYPGSHMKDILAIAEELCLPIIADEVYKDITFGEPFVACAAASSTVPVLSVCALSKRWLAPGWRLGWITVHDADGILKRAEVPETLLKLCQVSLGPSAPLQAALPEIFSETPQEWYDSVLRHLKESADCCIRRCRAMPGLSVTTEPQGSMYFMVKIDQSYFEPSVGDSDVTFAGQLLAEESVAVLPGQCFNAPGFFRVVFAAPPEVLNEAFDRMESFCRRHARV